MAAGVEDTTRVEVFGTKGALRFSFNQLGLVDVFDINTNRWYRGSLDFHPEGERPIETIWPSDKYSQGLMTNAHLACSYDFLLDIAEGKPSAPGFAAGLAVQEVLEAGYASARRGGVRVALP